MTLKKNNFLSYLLIIFPPMLVTGPFLPDLILSVSSIFFLFYLLSTKNLSFLKNDFIIISLIFYVYLVLGSLFSQEIIFSIKNTFFYFRFFIFAFLLKYLILNNQNFLKNFSLSIFFTLLIISIDAIIEFYLGYHWLFNKTNYTEFTIANRISGLFDEEYILGGFILSLFPASFLIVKNFFKITNLKLIKFTFFSYFFNFYISNYYFG